MKDVESRRGMGMGMSYTQARGMTRINKDGGEMAAKDKDEEEKKEDGRGWTLLYTLHETHTHRSDT